MSNNPTQSHISNTQLRQQMDAQTFNIQPSGQDEDDQQRSIEFIDHQYPLVYAPFTHQYFWQNSNDPAPVQEEDFESEIQDRFLNQLQHIMESYWRLNITSIGGQYFIDGDHIVQNNPRQAQKIDLKFKKINKSGEECSICYVNIRKNAKIPMIECNHMFHKKCLEKWIAVKSTCPLCRNKIE